jgi:hypothetical protein
MSTVMPTLTDADCIRVYRKQDMLNESAVRMGVEAPLWGDPYVTDFTVNDGLGFELESRQYVRIDGVAYRVREWHAGGDMDSYRFRVERVWEPEDWRPWLPGNDPLRAARPQGDREEPR